jgi:hypothetical protein
MRSDLLVWYSTHCGYLRGVMVAEEDGHHVRVHHVWWIDLDRGCLRRFTKSLVVFPSLVRSVPCQNKNELERQKER